MWNRVSRYDLRSASSLELQSRPAAVLLMAVALAGGCSNGARSVRLPALSPNEEVYRVSCEDSIRACRDEASKICAGDYEVIESTGAPIQPQRVTSAPGPASTGPRYQRLKWVGQMVIACARTTPSTAAAAEGAPPNEARGAVAVLPAPGRLCIPGVTQECLGPGACRGAQACLADGDGYGACDCGNASTHAPSESALGDAGARAHEGAPDGR